MSHLKSVKSDSNTDSKVKIVSLPKLIPNMLTILALCAGLSSIRFALIEKWEFVIFALLAAALFDILDGAMARLLKAGSALGAELDSLSDFLCFGVAPCIVLYLWIMQHAGGIGWFAVMAFTVATALRLARFNVDAKAEKNPEEDDKKSAYYFKGVPSPAGALLSLMPLSISLYFGSHSMAGFPITSSFVAIWILCIAGLMISNIPTYSIKRVKLPQKLAIPLLACVGLTIAALVTEPWLTLTLLGCIYLSLIPFSYFAHKRGANAVKEKTAKGRK